MSSSNHLPQEIIDMIVTEHEDNIFTLQQCVLVSKSFLAPAQKLIFSAIDLGVDDDDERSRRLYRRFRDITTTNPLILTYVRELCMTDNSSLHDPADNPRPSWIRDEPDLPGFLVTLINLQRLVFQGDLRWRSLPFALRSTLFAVFHKLEFLGLHGFHGIPQSVCAAWKNIRGLALWAITVDPEEVDEEIVISPLETQDARIEWLTLQMLQESTPRSVLNALTSHGTVLSSLISLSLGPFDDEEVLDSWEVMKSTKETLQFFSINYDYRSWDLPPIILEPITLADFKRLEHISYHVTYSQDEPSTTPFAGLLGLLETLHEENTVHWIFLRVDFPDNVAATQQLNSYDGWDTLDRLLAEDRFEQLELIHVVLALYTLENVAEAEETISEEWSRPDHNSGYLTNLKELVRRKLEVTNEAEMLSVSIQVVGP